MDRPCVPASMKAADKPYAMRRVALGAAPRLSLCALPRLFRCVWLTLALCACAIAAANAAATLTLSPATSKIEYTVFTFGMLPMSAYFTDFAGTISADLAPAGHCHVEVSVRIASLHMADPVRRRIALGASMLDASHFPTMNYSGQCIGATLTGGLTLHGITRQLVLTLRRQGAQIIATGTLQRRDYAMFGLPWLVGPRIRIRLQTPAPTAISAAP